MSVLPNSTFLDLTSWHGVPGGTSIASAYNINSTFTPGGSINVALILPRAEDPTALLQSNWATRQKTLADLNSHGTLWQHYGANQQDYNSLVAQMQATTGVTLLGQGNDGYVSSVESRTLWVKIDVSAFNTVFGTPLLGANAPGGNFEFWNGNLNAPGAVSEVFFDYGWDPAIQGQSTHPYSPGFGPQSIGNSATSPASLYPQQVAALYNFPLNGSVGVTGTLGLIEPGVGTALPAGTTASFGALLGAYLAQAGVAGSPNAYSVANGGQSYNSSSGGERSLDIGVAAAINPNAAFALYAGASSNSTTFTAYQSAFWDTTHNPEVISSSFWDNRWSAPGSPFFGAYQDLFVDAALRNISVFMAAGDGGSGGQWATGLNNLGYANSSPWTVQVGGSSLTLMHSAASDSTVVNAILTPAQAQDPAVIWGLMQSGLKTMPSALPPGSALLESAWNAYTINHDKAFVGSSLTNDFSGAGGVDTRLGVPDYQSRFGLTPTNSDSTGGTGRGMPDVTALAGGDTFWIAPIETMATTSNYWHGTSAAAPMWASLALQVDAVFHDQGLPPLGYAIDLLYTAAVIAPGSFNDILQGNNVSTFTSGSGAYTNDSTAVSPTGFGYFAAQGFDLTSGLGSPDALLLARALSAIAQQQMHFDSSPPLLDHEDGGLAAGWTSGADQSLLFQTMANSPVTVGIGIGTGFVGYTSSMPSGYAWTSRLAEQSLQADFDPNLVRLFDKQGQGALFETDVHKGLGLGVAIDQQLGSAIQASLSNPFGFADFFTNDGAVRVARAIAVAETVGGLNDQTAIVRVRQGGTDSLSVSFYKVDDFSGKIGDLHAGDAGYMEAALTRAYQLGSGGISMGGPGYGNFQQGSLQGVNAGDKVAMFLSDNTTGITYWAFSQGNETFAGQKVGHLWNYGLNTWGWEDQYGGGDHDYNDLVVQLDFTSAYGHGWLVHG